MTMKQIKLDYGMMMKEKKWIEMNDVTLVLLLLIKTRYLIKFWKHPQSYLPLLDADVAVALLMMREKPSLLLSKPSSIKLLIRV